MEKENEIKLKIINYLKKNNYQIESLFKPQTSSPISINDYVVKKDEKGVTLEIRPELEELLKDFSQKEIADAINEILTLLLDKIEKLENIK